MCVLHDRAIIHTHPTSSKPIVESIGIVVQVVVFEREA
jgi:hypothetical protein